MAEEEEEISMLAEIRRLSRAEPFQPFSIVMGSGSRYEIGEGDSVVIGRSMITVAVWRSGEHLLRLSQISELTVTEGAQ